MNWIGGVGLRPEAIQVSGEAGTASRLAVVVGCVFLGPVVHVELRLESGEMCVAQIPNGASGFHPGQSVHVAWNDADELRFPA